MTAAELVAEVSRRGFKVVVGDNGPSLRRVAAVGHLPAELLAELKEQRAEVLAYLAGRVATGDGLRCDVCDRVWFCSAEEVRDCVQSPAYCDRPAPQHRPPAKGMAPWATPCPWKQ